MALLKRCLSVGGVLDSIYLDYGSVVKLEKMPTKLELIKDTAVMIKKVLVFLQTMINVSFDLY